MPLLSIVLAPNDEWAVAMGDMGSVAAGAVSLVLAIGVSLGFLSIFFNKNLI